MHGWPWAAAALQHTGAAAFGGVRRSAGKQALQQAQRELGENIREGSRRWNIREGARQENIRECSRTEHRDRSRCKIDNEGVQRETAPGPELHTRCAQKLFKEALQRSSSEKLFREALQRSSSPRNKRRAPSLLCMAVRLRGGVVIPTRLSMHVATAKTVTETVTSARAHAAAARLFLAFSPQQTNSNPPFAPSPPTRLSARVAAPDTTRARQGPHRCRRNRL
jgi:hypothetical protein